LFDVGTEEAFIGISFIGHKKTQTQSYHYYFNIGEADNHMPIHTYT
jgi:hypothetical protein